jgi:DnaJ homolog subfamily C member 7
MVLPSLFTKSSKKSKHHDAPTLNRESSSHSKSNPGTPPSSPDKKSYNRVKDRERDKDRRSNSYSSKRSSKYDRDSHPLNLPPDELRRLSTSAMSHMSDQPTPQPMDVDREATSSPVPSSPAAAQTPGAFPKSNGVNGEQESRPAPPPHRYTTSPPPQSANYAATPEAASSPAQHPTIDAEEYKAAGNKFFKIKDYTQAAKEYSKGEHCTLSLRLSGCVLPSARLARPLHYNCLG